MNGSNKSVWKVSLLDRNTWYHITVYKVICIKKNNRSLFTKNYNNLFILLIWEFFIPPLEDGFPLEIQNAESKSVMESSTKTPMLPQEERNNDKLNKTKHDQKESYKIILKESRLEKCQSKNKKGN